MTEELNMREKHKRGRYKGRYCDKSTGKARETHGKELRNKLCTDREIDFSSNYLTEMGQN